MFCPNCGNNCGDANFCSKCGAKLNDNISVASNHSVNDPPKSIYRATVNGQEVDLLTIVGKYGCDSPGVYKHLKQKYGISREQAEELLAPYVLMKATNSPRKSIFSELVKSSYEQAQIDASKKSAEKEHRKELDDSGQVYCPKCLSTSISADKKGFGIGKAVIGAAAFGGIGLAAGNIGSKKVICTCLKCGYKWKAGKK